LIGVGGFPNNTILDAQVKAIVPAWCGLRWRA